MFRLAWLALVPLFAVTGCLDFDGEEQRTLPLVSGAPAVAAKPGVQPRQVSTAAANEASARRVIEVGQRLIQANRQIALRPLFVTVGVPQPEVFHKGGVMGGCQVIVSEGLVQSCPSDSHLAAVLSLELAKLVTEREALVGPSARNKKDAASPSEAIGNDSGGAFGPPDGTRLMELARDETRRRAANAGARPLDPKALAGGYLARAGYEPAALVQVEPVLRQAEAHYDLEKQFRAGAGGDGQGVMPPAPLTP